MAPLKLWGPRSSRKPSRDRKSTRLNSSHGYISYAVFCLKKKSLTEPTGATLCVWQPRGHLGAEIVSAPAALSWIELHTTDLQRAESCYSGLFDCSLDAMD